MATDQHVETVVIEEPSDRNEATSQEKPCFTKKHLYIAIGVVFVVAISLIGSLLDFSPADSGINEETIREGTLETWPEFDANNDGYVDLTEYTSWSAGRIAQRRRFVTPWTPEPTQLETNYDGTNTTVPTQPECQTRFGPIDLNGDGRISRDEAIAFALRLLERIIRLIGFEQPNLEPVQSAVQPVVHNQEECPLPTLPGFPARCPRGWVGACKAGYQIWCYSSEFCRNKRKCHKSVITLEWTTTDTCCGGDHAANCTTCQCGGSYTFVPAGRNSRLRSLCHWLSELHCGDQPTGVPVW